MFILVSPFWKTFDDVWLVYFVPDHLENEIKKWIIVEIPIKSNIEDWVILEILQETDIDFDISKIKSMISVKNWEVFLKDYQLLLVRWIAKFYFSSIHNALNLFFPRNLKEKILKWTLKENIKPEDKIDYKNTISLNSSQQETYNKITKPDNKKILLYWVTGSWKTEIYIKLIEDCIEQWKQSLLLIPEIILTNQIAKKIEKVFPTWLVIINSSITEATKTKYWQSINSWDTKIIIWTRSAIFYPFSNLWQIIIDEEHDNSYLSDKTPRYNTIEIAEQISELLDIRMLLASWTPSIKSMYKALKGDYTLVNLLEKYK